MVTDLELARCNGLKEDEVKIMVQASICLQREPAAVVEIRRGMILISVEGKEAGKVAGVAVSQDGRQVLCLILSHLPVEAGYQSIPVRWIERVEGEMIFLNAPVERILAVPGWHAG